jgi:hypothetical protein
MAPMTQIDQFLIIWPTDYWSGLWIALVIAFAFWLIVYWPSDWDIL